MEKTRFQKNCLNFRFGVFAVLVSAVSVTLFSGCGKPGRDQKGLTALTQIKLLDDAIRQYKLDVGTYPSQLECLMQNLDQSERWDGPYIKPKVPKDPWGIDYIYVIPGEHGEFDLFSYGADGMPGGDGDKADLNNWE